jgi:hypothetical protein
MKKVLNKKKGNQTDRTEPAWFSPVSQPRTRKPHETTDGPRPAYPDARSSLAASALSFLFFLSFSFPDTWRPLVIPHLRPGIHHEHVSDPNQSITIFSQFLFGICPLVHANFPYKFPRIRPSFLFRFS